MPEEMDKQHIKELKQMIQEKKPKNQWRTFLLSSARGHGVSLNTWQIHYRRLVEKAKSKKNSSKTNKTSATIGA